MILKHFFQEVSEYESNDILWSDHFPILADLADLAENQPFQGLFFQKKKENGSDLTHFMKIPYFAAPFFLRFFF